MTVTFTLRILPYNNLKQYMELYVWGLAPPGWLKQFVIQRNKMKIGGDVVTHDWVDITNQWVEKINDCNR